MAADVLHIVILTPILGGLGIGDGPVALVLTIGIAEWQRRPVPKNLYYLIG
jgi:hypothetical protein